MNGAPSSAERRAILEGLESTDEEVRRIAVEQLLQLPTEEAVVHLETHLGDPRWRVRKSVVDQCVRARETARVHDMLLRSLADADDPGRRNAAFEALVACGQRVTPALVAELSNPDVDVRKLVVDACAAIGDPAVRPELRALLTDEDANVRAATAEALGVVGGVEEITHLIELAADSDDDVLVRLSALRALAKMEAGVGVESLGDVFEEPLLRPAAFGLLGCSSDPMALEILVKGLGSGSRSAREGAMSALLRAMSRLDGEAADQLVERLRTAAASNSRLVTMGCERLEQADGEARLVLIQFLGLLGDPRVVVPLLRVGQDETIAEVAEETLQSMGATVAAALSEAWPTLDYDLKMRACPVLGRLAGEESEALLMEALGTQDGDLRSVAAMALGEGGFFSRLPELIRCLEIAAREDDIEGQEEVDRVIRAIVQLAEHPDSSSAGIDDQLIDVLSSRLAGAAQPVRLAIANVVARVGGETDDDLIRYLLKDESPSVRRAAVQALGRFSFDHAQDALRLALADESSPVRIGAASVMGASGELGCIDDLARQIQDEDARVAAVAVRALGQICRVHSEAVSTVEPLMEASLQGDALVALAGIEALTELGGALPGRLVPSVLGRDEPDVVRAAVACLGAHTRGDALSELTPLVGHADWSVRAEVIQVLSDRNDRKSLPALLRRLEVEGDPFVREAILQAVARLED